MHASIYTGWYTFSIAFLKQAPTRADDVPLLRLRWGYSDPTAPDDDHDRDDDNEPPEELPPQEVLPSMLFRARAPDSCLDKPLGDIGNLVDDLALAPAPGAPCDMMPCNTKAIITAAHRGCNAGASACPCPHPSGCDGCAAAIQP